MFYQLKRIFKGILYHLNEKVKYKGLLKDGKYDGEGILIIQYMIYINLEGIFYDWKGEMKC